MEARTGAEESGGGSGLGGGYIPLTGFGTMVVTEPWSRSRGIDSMRCPWGQSTMNPLEWSAAAADS